MILRVILSMIFYYSAYSITNVILFVPNDSLIGISGSVPPLLGLVWGMPAAVGCMAGALLSEISDWQYIAEISQQGDYTAVAWESLLLFCNCGFWAFVAAYLPWRLWHSLLPLPDKMTGPSRANVILKFVWIMFLSTATSSVFLALTTSLEDMSRLIDGINNNLGTAAEYAIICFLNDFDFTIFFGLPAFFFLKTYNIEFHQPTVTKDPNPKTQRKFDVLFGIALAIGLYLCRPQMVDYEFCRFVVGAVLVLYMFRPMNQLPTVGIKHEKILREGDTSHRIAALFYGFLLVLLFGLENSGTIHGLDNMETWQQFNAECITMMNVAIIALLYILLRYRHSVMTNVVMLEVATVFVSAFALGAVCFMITDRLTTRNVDDSIAEMSIICRERIKRTFDGIQVSVNDIRDLALARTESYELLVNDENWRRQYLADSERLFHAIASNTDGSVAFYMRLDPAFAGGMGGFSWGREKNRWEGAQPSFVRRLPIDLAKYSPDDYKNVGWYYIPVARHSATWIEPYIDPTVQVYVISYVSPIYVQDKLVGVVGMDIDFDYLIHEIRRLSVYEYGFTYLLARDGSVLYHKDFAQGEKFVSNPEYRELETYLTNGIWLGIAMPMADIYAERNNLLMHLVCVMLTVAVLVSCFSISLASRGIRPLVALTEATQKIAAGNLNVKLPAESQNELGILVKSVREMVGKLEVFVYRDKLTGLGNTTAYARKCDELASIPESELKYALVVFDVNFLKKINDTYGHEAGNELIRCAAGIIVKVFAGSPAFRIGGDEFVVILEGANYLDREELVRKFDLVVANKHFSVGNDEFILSIARGMAVWRSGLDYAAVFQDADDAMYMHKAAIKHALGEAVR